ncbi:MAG: hypothetical protein R3248_13275 [Candidatus Promineifilaceae bacterium]|nr:hypothetical protein [Candidatus Promineifilaceae bacterium]
MALSRTKFLKGMPEIVVAHLPSALQEMKVRQPYRWLVQFHYGEPRLHYEISGAKHRPGWELGFHCEAKDKRLNRFLLQGFRRHLFEIKETLGEQVEAEMWDRGWTKIYEVYPEGKLTEAYQQQVGARLAAFIACLHPIYVELRNTVSRSYR